MAAPLQPPLVPGAPGAYSLNDDVRSTLLNFCCVVVFVELASQYDQCEAEAVSASLMRLLGAEANTPVDIIAQIAEHI